MVLDYVDGIDASKELNEKLNCIGPARSRFLFPTSDLGTGLWIQRGLLCDRAQHGLILRSTARHLLKQRLENTKGCRRPKIGYSDNIEKDEPAAGIPDTAPQSPEQMSL
ncbi:MAG: hypothetical protein WCC90_19275, partial [Methylocella sp.]